MRGSVNASAFASRTRGARRVGVVDLGFLGDSVHLIPALREVRRGYPGARLEVVSTPVGCEVLRLAECADAYWALELRPERRRWWDQVRLLGAVRRAKWEVAINLSAVDRSILLMGLTGARWRLGHLGGRRHFWNRWLIPDWVPQQPQDLPVYEQRRRALTAAGFQVGPVEFGLRVSEDARAWARGEWGLDREAREGVLHLSLSASTPLKEWPLDRYGAFCRAVWAQAPDVRFVVTSAASAREEARVRGFIEGLGGDGRVRVVPAGLSLERLAAVLEACTGHVGPDSGVVHLAMALGVRTVSWFRRRGAWRAWAPWGEGHWVLAAECGCADDRGSRCERLGVAECLAGIGVGEVVEAVRECLGRKASLEAGRGIDNVGGTHG